MFDYADIVWGVKDNAVLMNTLQLLQNKAAKTILDRPFHSSVVNADFFIVAFTFVLLRSQPTAWICWQIKIYMATIRDTKMT